jgi:hypothetical protein
MHLSRPLHRPLLVLITVLLASAASLVGVAHAAAPQAKWTVMVYISGDNNLEDYVVKDLELELGAVGSDANVQIVALADRGPGYDTSYGDWQTTKLYHVTQGMKADSASAVADWGERNMGDKQTLMDFVTWSKTNYPADHYALFFWGHGWSWHPGWVMEDDTPGDTLDYDEVKAAQPTLGFIDVVGYDGCNMASLEIFKLWHNKATAVTGSQEYVGWDGLEYDVFLGKLKANPLMTADSLAMEASKSTVTDKTWSAVATDSRLNTLLTAVDAFGTSMTNALGTERKAITSAAGLTRTFNQAPMDKDLYDLASQVNTKVSNATVKTRAQAVMSAYAGVVLHERHVANYAGSHGITIYFPSTKTQKVDRAYYDMLDLSQTTSWNEFLAAFG